MNEDTWENLDTSERRDHELTRGYLNDAPGEYGDERRDINLELENEAENLERRNLLKWWPLDDQEMKTTLKCSGWVRKELRDWKQFERMATSKNHESSRERTKIQEKFFFGLQMLRMTMRNTTMNCWGTPEWQLERLNQQWEEFERSWIKTFDWW